MLLKILLELGELWLESDPKILTFTINYKLYTAM